MQCKKGRERVVYTISSSTSAPLSHTKYLDVTIRIRIDNLLGLIDQGKQSQRGSTLLSYQRIINIYDKNLTTTII